MSTTHAVRPADATNVPPVLPVISMTVAADRTMTVAVDGVRFEPPRFGLPWGRSSFAAVIDSVLEEQGSPVRVLVYEADGAVFTDLITRPLQRTLDATARPPARADAAGSGRNVNDSLIDATPLIAPSRVVLEEEGFIAGEEVAVAIVVRHIKASADGSARALVEPALCEASAGGEVVLVGRVSGTCIVGDLG